MLRGKTFIKKSRKGAVRKVVREHYLRDDIPCGVPACTHCAPTAADGSYHNLADEATRHILVIDTNVVLHQPDCLEHPAVVNVVVPQTVLEESQHRSSAIHQRLRAIVANPDKRFYVFSNEHHRDTFVDRLPDESPNDRNDRAIRKVAQWYSQHLAGTLAQAKVILVTNDADNKARALKDGLAAMTVAEYVRDVVRDKDLLDVVSRERPVAAPPVAGAAGGAGGDGPARDKTTGFSSYLAEATLQAGLASGRFLRGKIRMNRYNCREANVSTQSTEYPDGRVLVQGAAINRAVDGDDVVIEVLPKDQWGGEAVEDNDAGETGGAGAKMEIDAAHAKPTGRVVGIVKRNWRQYCGSILPPQSGKSGYGSTSVLFQPINPSIPRIRMRTSQLQDLVGLRIVVAIDDWDKASMYPSGHYVRKIGPIGDKETEVEVLLIENDVPFQPFSRAVLACLPEEGENFSFPKEPKRQDCRHLNICSVDPPGCTDIDDALHVRKLDDGTLEVGVHIADVSSFVKPGTPIDAEAANRGTTVYLVDRRIDMLPGLLGTNLCSLRSNVDRYAFSVVWIMDAETFEIKDTKFGRTLIRSKASLAYKEAQAIMDDPSRTDALARDLRQLLAISKKLRKERMDKGSLTLSSPEVSFTLDQDARDPTEVHHHEMLPANNMIEEFMLLANIAVAQRMLQFFPTSALLRRHPTPSSTMFEPLVHAASLLSVTIKTDTSKILADSLDEAIVKGNPYFNTLIRIMATRCMTQAVYFASGTVPEELYLHYGLALPIYTHFTSPIRRYADLLVHRLLAASLQLESAPENLLDKTRLQSVCDTINFRNRMAQQAGRDSVALYTHLFFRNRAEQREAYVLRVRKNAFYVLVPRYGIESAVSVDQDQYKYDHDNMQLVATRGRSIRIFDKVQVKISIVDTKDIRQKLHIELLDEDEVDGDDEEEGEDDEEERDDDDAAAMKDDDDDDDDKDADGDVEMAPPKKKKDKKGKKDKKDKKRSKKKQRRE